MGLSNNLSCEAGSFSPCCNTLRFLQPEVLRLYFPTLEPWVVWSVLLPSCFSQFIHLQMWDGPLPQLLPLLFGPPSGPCPLSSPPWLLISTPPTSLDECFFFNSLVVGLPYNLIFIRFWLILFLNLFLSFFWLWEEAKCIYLHLHLGQKSHCLSPVLMPPSIYGIKFWVKC